MLAEESSATMLLDSFSFSFYARFTITSTDLCKDERCIGKIKWRRRRRQRRWQRLMTLMMMMMRERKTAKIKSLSAFTTKKWFHVFISNIEHTAKHTKKKRRKKTEKHYTKSRDTFHSLNDLPTSTHHHHYDWTKNDLSTNIGRYPSQ